MPNYGTLQSGGGVTAVAPGDSMVLFNAESPTAPQASIAFARGIGITGQPSGIVFTAKWAAAPTATLAIQGSNADVDADYQTLNTVTNSQYANYADVGNFLFYRGKLLTQSAGGAVTLIAQR